MRRELRAVMVAALVAVLVIDPATACHYYGYYSGCSAPCGSYCEPVSYCGCCGCEVVECSSCGCDGEVVYDEPSSDATPEGMYEPSEERAMPRSGPANVHRPVDQMPRPELPTRSMTPPEEPMQPSRVEPTTPSPTQPSADDLFGPPSEPMAEPSNDLFGPADEPAETVEEQPPARAETTETAPPMDRYAPPAEETSGPTSDDLFGPTDSEPAEPESTDEPASEPAFDFFDTPSTDDQPMEEKPMEEEEQPAPVEQDEDDLFGGFGAILRESGGLASAELREWVDNTGEYSCRGRLIRVLDGKVQLLKNNGRTTTVPFGRLSRGDLNFVYRQASAQRTEAVSQTAQVTPQRPAH